MIKPGDIVQVVHDAAHLNRQQKQDYRKHRQLGMSSKSMFVGNASSYLSPETDYTVERVTENGGVRLKGFMLTVSAKDLRLV